MKAKNGNGTEGNGNNEVKKKWNAAVVSLDGNGKTRGLLHHIRSRRSEFLEACLKWPDLLLKAAYTAVGGKCNEEFCQFLCECPDELIQRAIIGVSLPSHLDVMWQAVVERIPRYATPALFEKILFLEPTSEIGSSMIMLWLGGGHDDYWMPRLAQAKAGRKLDDQIIRRTIASQISFGKLPILVPYRNLSVFDHETRVVQDPRKRMELTDVVWQVDDPKTGKALGGYVTDAFRRLQMPDSFYGYIEAVMACEEHFLEALKHWHELCEDAKRWIPGNKLTRVYPSFWGIKPEEVGITRIVVDPSNREFPKVGVDITYSAFFGEYKDHFEVDEYGQPDLSEWPDGIQRAFRLGVWIALAQVLSEYACASKVEDEADVKDKKSSKKSKTGLCVEYGVRKPVSPTFVRLQAGHKRSHDAEKRSHETWPDMPLPDGKTFRNSPPIPKSKSRTNEPPPVYDPITIKARIQAPPQANGCESD